MDLSKIKSNKYVAGILFIVGLCMSLLVDEILIVPYLITKTTLLGMGIGLLWSGIRYFKYKEEGIVKSQKELGGVFIYIAYFVGGFILGVLIKKIIGI